jgi:hypothetical protein
VIELISTSKKDTHEPCPVIFKLRPERGGKSLEAMFLNVLIAIESDALIAKKMSSI